MSFVYAKHFTQGRINAAQIDGTLDHTDAMIFEFTNEEDLDFTANLQGKTERQPSRPCLCRRYSIW